MRKSLDTRRYRLRSGSHVNKSYAYGKFTASLFSGVWRHNQCDDRNRACSPPPPLFHFCTDRWVQSSSKYLMWKENTEKRLLRRWHRMVGRHKKCHWPKDRSADRLKVCTTLQSPWLAFLLLSASLCLAFFCVVNESIYCCTIRCMLKCMTSAVLLNCFSEAHFSRKADIE